MKPYLHGLISVKKFGGKPEDYQAIHDFFDQTKAFVPDMRHRAILHNAFGIFLCEKFFGTNITNSDGKLVSVRDVGEQHVLDDLGTIPTVQDYLTYLPALDWLGGPKRKRGVKADEVTRHPPDEPEAVAVGAAPPPPKPLIGGIELDWGDYLRQAAEARTEWEKMQQRATKQYDWGPKTFPAEQITVVD